MIIDTILKNCGRDTNKAAIFYKDTVVSYGSLRAKIEEYIKIVGSLQVNEYEAVGLVYDNEPEFIFWILALFKSENPAALIPVYFRQSEIEYHVKNLNLRYIVVQKKYKERYENMSVEKEGTDFVILRNKVSSEYRQMCNCNDRIIQFTSGSQGESKSVARTEKACYSEIIALEKPFTALDGTEVFMPLSPLFHSYGLLGGTLFPLYHGLSVVLEDIRFPKYILSEIARRNVTHMFVTPFIYKMFCDVLQLNNETFDFSSVRRSFSAGGAIEMETVLRMKELSGVDIYQNYGSTEAGTMAVGVNPLSEDNSMGEFLADAQKVLRPLEFIPEENCGELLLKSDIIDFHYLYPEKLNQDKFYNELFITGDVMKKVDGKMYYNGRSDGLININGLKVYANEVEDIIKQMDEVEGISAVGIQAGNDDILVAYVVVRKGAVLSENIIKQYCKNYMADYKIPNKIIFLDELPKNSSGKILKKYLVRGEN
ncbi:MAG: class I adenylate-forming enzyme family protein [Velocimicrobium sp.]